MPSHTRAAAPGPGPSFRFGHVPKRSPELGPASFFWALMPLGLHGQMRHGKEEDPSIPDIGFLSGNLTKTGSEGMTPMNRPFPGNDPYKPSISRE